MRMADLRGVDADFEERILQHVSRSFALTIPQLPHPLRKPVTNAYLLCRIIDTIEDDENLSLDQRRFFLQQFIQVLEGHPSAGEFAGSLVPLLSERTLPEEKELIRNAPAVIQTTRTFNKTQQVAIGRCAAIMARGMLGFQENKGAQGLKDLSHMDRYCYYVAGAVGEMLTELFCDYSPAISTRRKELMSLARSFGQGLQMTNIIKDLWEDKQRNACWLPQDVFQKAGYDLKNLSAGIYTKEFGQGVARLIGIARDHLRNALAYTLLIPPGERGIRKFCLWAIGMALLTLRKINKKRDYKSGLEVKISRRSVRGIILVTNATLGSNLFLKGLFAILAGGLPVADPTTGPSRQ
jgi:farnesyl-diphosphate farnesyltransferase